MKDLMIDQMNAERQAELAEIHQREIQENQAEDSMRITVIEIPDKDLFEGAKVRNKKTGEIRTIKSIPDGMTLYEAVTKGIFDIKNEIDYKTVFLNINRFELVKEDDDEF
jgi:hypothetical protein